MWTVWKPWAVQNKKITEVPKVPVPLVKEEPTDLFDFIIWWEWSVQLTAFCDSYYRKDWKLIRKSWAACTRWSIGHWTISYRWETITKVVAHERMVSYLDNISNKIPSCWTTNQMIAILDYQYQFGTYSRNIHKYVERCSYKDVKYILYPYDKYTTWIEKRRIRWYNLFNK